MYLSFLDSELEINDMFCSYLSAPISPTFIVHFIKPFVFVYPSTLKSCDSQCHCKVKKNPNRRCFVPRGRYNESKSESTPIQNQFSYLRRTSQQMASKLNSPSDFAAGKKKGTYFHMPIVCFLNENSNCSLCRVCQDFIIH